MVIGIIVIIIKLRSYTLKKIKLPKKANKGIVIFSIGDEFYNCKNFNNLYYYSGNDLGFTYTKGGTSFKVWAPFAINLSLVVYKNGDIEVIEKGTEYQMEKGIKGTWKVFIKGNLNGMFYTYKIINPGFKEQETGDPYAKAVGINGDRSAVIDLNLVKPENWEMDKKPILDNITDAVIYELHIRDLAMNKDSGIKNKGKFIQFAENTPNGINGITLGVNHLKELGINVVHLLPTFDFATIDEKTLEKNEFNWGYDPQNYNVPEGSYCTNPNNPEVRILEFKEMIAALHRQEIRVVMDVVYNHTNDNVTSKFNIIVPGYYYRMNSDGSFINGSGCGNDTASERVMMRKYIVDSVKYWATEYHVDGFRFDLMGLHDIETMKEVKNELSKIDKSLIVYGEGWDMGTLPRTVKAIQPHSSQLEGIGFFNDNIRDALKGSWNDKLGHGYVDGKQNYELEIMEAIVGGVTYNSIVKDYNTEPGQSINYVECHDDNTLWDKLLATNPMVSEVDRIKMHTLAGAVVLTSQGVPFMSAGMEFLRTKNGDENSYKSPDSINSLDFASKAKNIKTFDYYKGLIELRKSHPAFRMTTTEMLKENLTFVQTPRNTVGYLLKNNANNDSWKNIFIAFNANLTDESIMIPKGNWNIVVFNDKAGIKTLEKYNGNQIKIPALTTIVMYSNESVYIKDLFEGKTIAKGILNTNIIDIKGENVRLESNVIQNNETIYLPIVSLARAIGKVVTVEGESSEATIVKGKDNVVIYGKTITFNGKIISSSDNIKTDNSVALVSAGLIEALLEIKIFADYRRFNVDSTRGDDKIPDIYIIY